MTEDKKKLPRPRQVTTASVITVVGSAVLILGLVDSLGRLRTPDTRRTIDDFLAEPPGNGLGIDTAQVVELLRVLVYVSGVLAAVTLVLGVFLAQRHHGARIGLTVAAALLLLTVPVAGLMPLFVAVAVGLAWSRPARDWFAGRAPVADGPRTGRAFSGTEPGSPEPQPWAVPQPPPEPTTPPTTPPTTGAAPQPAPEPTTPPAAYPPTWPPPPSPRSDRRPVTVTVAAVLTWIGAGATAAMMLLFGAVLATSPDAFVDQFDEVARSSTTELSLSRSEVLAVGWAVAATMLVWSLIAILLAVLAFRRSNIARVLLAISAVMTALVSLLSILSLVAGVTLLLGIATAVLLFTGGANGWYSRRDQQPGQRGPYGPYGQHGQPGAPWGTPPGGPPPVDRNKPW